MKAEFGISMWGKLMDEIQEEFELHVEPATARGWFVTLSEHYDQPWRRYHNKNHIASLLACFEKYSKSTCSSPMGMQLAIWFHDAKIVLNQKGNELCSALLFNHFGAEINLPTTLQKEVGGMILATDMETTPQTDDEMLIADMDIAGIGGTWEEFMRNNRWIGEEFAICLSLSATDFSRQCVTFFERLKKRDYIYHTRVFRERYENPARSNIARYLDAS